MYQLRVCEKTHTNHSYMMMLENVTQKIDELFFDVEKFTMYFYYVSNIILSSKRIYFIYSNNNNNTVCISLKFLCSIYNIQDLSQKIIIKTSLYCIKKICLFKILPIHSRERNKNTWNEFQSVIIIAKQQHKMIFYCVCVCTKTHIKFVKWAAWLL